MEAQELKEKIIDDDKLVLILEELGMHSIIDRDTYISCGMPDGDNKASTIVYKNSLHVDAYTRNITDSYGNTDLISLVSFIQDCYFTKAKKWLCDVCGYNFYNNEQSESRVLDWLNQMWKVQKEGTRNEDDILKPIDEKILHYYGRYGNPLFLNDGISYKTQWEFELGYDLNYHMITIPIRDELGSLVGIKGRLLKEEISEWESKYLYLQSCSKTKVLYGLNKTLPYIKAKKEVIVVESEKAVMQLWSRGIKNAVAIGGHKLSDTQVKKITHLGVPVVIAYDQGVEVVDGVIDKTFYPSEFNKFLPGQTVYCIYDKKKNILLDKESPSDNPNKWDYLYSNCKMKVRGE